MRIYTHESLGPKQSVTPDGFLLCEEVPIARTGHQLYMAQELPDLSADADKLIRVDRHPEDVFDDRSVASFAGKPVTNEHPPYKLTPDTWREHAVGVVLNPRRGDGSLDHNFLYADLLLHDKDAIKAVREGKREVSAGYDAEYQQERPGLARQTKIVGNHVALVDKGRCGFLCAIGDQAMPNNRAATRDRLLHAFRTHDEGAFLTELERVAGLEGKVLSGGEGNVSTTDDPPAERSVETGGPGHHITVNVGRGSDPSPPVNDDPAPEAAAAGGEATGIQAILSRLDSIEQALVLLAKQGDAGEEGDEDDEDEGDWEGGEEEGEDDSVTGDRRPARDRNFVNVRGPRRGARDFRRDRGPGRRRTRDEDATAPDSENPELRPSGGPTAPPDVPGKTVTDKRFTGDSRSMQAEHAETLARAEMLVPGVRLPTFDAKKPAKMTYDALCAFRRSVLNDTLRSNTQSRDYVQAMLGDTTPDFSRMTCDTVAMVFNGASEMARQANNMRMGTGVTRASNGAFGGAPSPSEINKRNREFWNQH